MTADINLPLIALVSIIGLILLLGASYYLLFLRKPKTPAWVEKLTKKYQEILSKDLAKDHLIIELDKLTEKVLQNKFSSPGSGFGEILKAKKSKFSKSELNNLWQAHKLRNQIVHDIDVKLSPSEVNHAIIVYKQFIKQSLAN